MKNLFGFKLLFRQLPAVSQKQETLEATLLDSSISAKFGFEPDATLEGHSTVLDLSSALSGKFGPEPDDFGFAESV